MSGIALSPTELLQHFIAHYRITAEESKTLFALCHSSTVDRRTVGTSSFITSATNTFFSYLGTSGRMDDGVAQRLFKCLAWQSKLAGEGVQTNILQSCSALAMLDMSLPFDERCEIVRSFAQRGCHRQYRLSRNEVQRLVWCLFVPAQRACVALHLHQSQRSSTQKRGATSIVWNKLSSLYSADLEGTILAVRDVVRRIFTSVAVDPDDVDDNETGKPIPTIGFDQLLSELRYVDDPVNSLHVLSFSFLFFSHKLMFAFSLSFLSHFSLAHSLVPRRGNAWCEAFSRRCWRKKHIALVNANYAEPTTEEFYDGHSHWYVDKGGEWKVSVEGGAVGDASESQLWRNSIESALYQMQEEISATWVRLLVNEEVSPMGAAKQLQVEEEMVEMKVVEKVKRNLENNNGAGSGMEAALERHNKRKTEERIREEERMLEKDRIAALESSSSSYSSSSSSYDSDSDTGSGSNADGSEWESGSSYWSNSSYHSSDYGSNYSESIRSEDEDESYFNGRSGLSAEEEADAILEAVEDHLSREHGGDEGTFSSLFLFFIFYLLFFECRQYFSRKCC